MTSNNEIKIERSEILLKSID